MHTTEADRLRGMNSRSVHGTLSGYDIRHAQLGRSGQRRPRAAALGAVLPALVAGNSTRRQPTHWLHKTHCRSSPAERCAPAADAPTGPCNVATDAAEHTPINCTSPHSCDDLPSLNITTTTAANITQYTSQITLCMKLSYFCTSISDNYFSNC